MLEPHFDDDIFSQNIEIEIPNIEPIDYKDTILKDAIEDIVYSQSNIENKLDDIAYENKKSGKTNFKIALWTLILALLTLIATIIGIFI